MTPNPPPTAPVPTQTEALRERLIQLAMQHESAAEQAGRYVLMCGHWDTATRNAWRHALDAESLRAAASALLAAETRERALSGRLDALLTQLNVLESALAEAESDGTAFRERAEQAEASATALREALGGDTPWPVSDLLRRLAGAAVHLLEVHDCDAHGWEGVKYAAEAAIRRADIIDAALRPDAPVPSVVTADSRSELLDKLGPLAPVASELLQRMAEDAPAPVTAQVDDAAKTEAAPMRNAESPSGVQALGSSGIVTHPSHALDSRGYSCLRCSAVQGEIAAGIKCPFGAPVTAETPDACAHGHTSRRVGCASCALLFNHSRYQAAPTSAQGAAPTFAIERKTAEYLVRVLNERDKNDHACRQCVGDNAMSPTFVCVRHRLEAWLSSPSAVPAFDPAQLRALIAQWREEADGLDDGTNGLTKCSAIARRLRHCAACVDASLDGLPGATEPQP